MDIQSAYECTPRQARGFIIACIQAGLVALLRSSPAMGKSAIIRSIAAEYGLKVIDLRLSQATPEDLQGLPRFRDILDNEGNPIRSISEFVPFDVFPVESTPIPDGFNGWLLFLDELTSANRAVQAAGYKLVLDKLVGQERLHPNVAIVCAGNLETDKAIVNPLSTAMQSRLVHLKMRLNHNEFMEDVAYPFDWDNRIIAYLNYKSSALYDFDPDHDGHTFCSPRTWEFMNRLIKGKPVRHEDAPLYAGTITAGTAVEFITFTEVFDTLPQVSEIVRRPEEVPLPGDPPKKYAVITHLQEKVTESTFEPIATYVNRMGSEFRVLFFRGLMIRKPELRAHPIFRKALLELSKYLHDPDQPTAQAA